MSSNQSLARSWTSDEAPKHGKWPRFALLASVLCVAVYVFAILIWPQEKPNSYLVSIAVPEYDETLLPQPAFANWTWDSIHESLPRRGLETVAKIRRSSFLPNSKSELENSLGELRNELSQAEINPRDTIWIYLRGHAVSISGQPYLLTSEVTQSDIPRAQDGGPDSERSDSNREIRGAVPLARLLPSLTKLPADNVVLLADIVDLRSIPELGVLANDVPNLLAREMKDIGGKANLWVVTPAASLQPTHISLLSRQTLMQAACDYALDASRGDKQAGLVSLQSLYAAMLRYCHHVTRGQQTPLLYRNGSDKPVSESTLAVWEAAGKVRLTSILRERTANRDDKGNSDDADETDQSTQAARAPLPAGRLVAVQSRGQSEVPANRSAKPTEATPDQGNPAEENSHGESGAQALEQSPWLRFWQLQERLAQRRNPAGWSPADFAPALWNEIQTDVLRLERLRAVGERVDEGEITSRAETLIRLDETFHAQSHTPSAGKNSATNDDELLTAWGEFQRLLTPESGKQAWLRPQALSADLREHWLQVRGTYRQFIDAMASLGGWQRTVLMSDTTDRLEMIQHLDELTRSLLEVGSHLPRQGNGTIMDHDSPRLPVAKIQPSLEKLRSIRAMHVSDLHSRLKATPDQQIDWRTEHLVQELLWNPGLEYESRKLLHTAYNTLTIDDLQRPGVDIAIDTNRPLEELLPKSVADVQTAAALASWANAYTGALRLGTMDEPIAPPTDSTPSALNQWWQSVTETGRRQPREGSLQSWMRACLYNPLSSGASGRANAGVILAISSDDKLESLVPDRAKLSEELVCEVRRRNGTPVRTCFFQWSLTPGARQSLGVTEALSVLASGTDLPLDPDTPHEIATLGGTLRLRLRTDADQASVREGIPLEIRIADSEAELSQRAPMQVLVTLPNPDRVDIYVRNRNSAESDSPWLFSKRTEIGGLLSALKTPAIAAQAASEYELYAANRADRNKMVQIKIYAVQSSQTIGNGTIDIGAAELTKRKYPRLTPLFVSEPIELPQNSGDSGNSDLTVPPSNGQRVILRPVEESDGGDDADLPPNAGQFGLMCVVQEIAAGEVDDASAPRVLNRAPHFHWIECLPQNPYGVLIEADPQPREGEFLLQLSGVAAEWKRWNLEELSVHARITDTDGNPVGMQGESAVTLTSEKLSASVRMRVSDRSSTRYVAHLDIGGYARAIAFESRLRGIPGETRSSSQPFGWLQPAQLRLIPTDGREPISPIELPGEPNTFVIPAREKVSDESNGEKLSFERLELPFELELPAPYRASVALDQRRQVFQYDRLYEPQFDLNQGNLVFRAAVSPQLTFSSPIPPGEFTGHNRLTLKLEPDGTTRSADLLFDNQPPPPAAVERELPELYLDEELEIYTFANDAESAISQVYFAISSDSRSNRYRLTDSLHMKAQPSGDRWVYILTADDLKDLPEGSYDLVCRTVDLAGNVQDQNISRSFRWIRKKRPETSEKPLPSPTATATPEQPEKYMVRVKLMVDGTPPRSAGNTQVSGLPGEGKYNVKGAWSFTQVPAGSYNISASYTDAFGVKYSGAVRINVSATSQKHVEIDLKRDR